MASFGDRLKELRKKSNLTQQELASKFYLNKSSISRYENGTQLPEHELLEKIADYFDVSIDYLLGRTNIIKPSELETTISNKNKETKQDNKRDEAEMLARKFLNMLIDAGEIKTKEDLTTDKALIILSKIFKELEEDTK